jgi:hypothetical protein
MGKLVWKIIGTGAEVAAAMVTKKLPGGAPRE